ncbi:glutaminyl-peptide cyclotransferase-like isoform X1 [Cornus florida]|uniref:glutaminyl-peptide cyclotransferase-like isoform X1 n=1 Tax=Cornus florida TaxID=4283 RepID=UPI0028990D01|nr:glutaminyl-peptide cyclotransferase-like isoform X1 [Cornus florida]XP_059629207.1 glutaminyl-peptide cyclotransferase-like isoform X1 [Cornus florida]XP_059629208.1 glutaminyl-peptide cyclotransferase-like isoform X1 [Cornus florida]XP_059629210.1 glutaminyl-peptide cyclotransferase-like isoform X1 [Cornus florida]
MASSSSSSRFSYKKISMFVSIVLIINIVVLLSKSSNMWSIVGINAHSNNLYSIEVVNEFPHDPKPTQGLLYGGNDTLLESTGLYRQSTVRKVAIQTGKVEALQKMDDSQFGEGLTLPGERLYQVTWLKKTGFIYDRYNLSKLDKFTHQMQDGWGLATDGKVLFGTDGTSMLYQIDPQTFKVIGKRTIRYKGHEVHNLNELEYVNGEVWANVWQSIMKHKQLLELKWESKAAIEAELCLIGTRLLKFSSMHVFDLGQLISCGQ